MLGQRADAIAVEGMLLSDMGEDLTGAANVAGRSVFQHEDEKLVAHRAVGLAAKGLAAARQFGVQRAAVGGQVGEAAAG